MKLKLLSARPSLAVSGLYGLSLGLGVLAGCASVSPESLQAAVELTSTVAQTGSQMEAARRERRQQQQLAAQSNHPQPAAPAPTAPPPAAARPAAPATYAALSCAALTRRGSNQCLENSCGRPVLVHIRSAAGATATLPANAGQCATVAPGNMAVACSGSDRFDWQRRNCIPS